MEGGCPESAGLIGRICDICQVDCDDRVCPTCIQVLDSLESKQQYLDYEYTRPDHTYLSQRMASPFSRISFIHVIIPIDEWRTKHVVSRHQEVVPPSCRSLRSVPIWFEHWETQAYVQDTGCSPRIPEPHPYERSFLLHQPLQRQQKVLFWSFVSDYIVLLMASIDSEDHQ